MLGREVRVLATAEAYFLRKTIKDEADQMCLACSGPGEEGNGSSPLWSAFPEAPQQETEGT